MKGFTIIEMLVVIALMAIAGTIIAGIFISSLRGSEKAKYLAVIKQNGQAVLENMDKTVRNADQVVCPLDNTPAQTLAVVKNGSYTRYRFKSAANVNGYIEQDSPANFTVSTCIITDPSVSPVILTDNNLNTGVSIESGSFRRYKFAGFKDGVDISFNIKPAISASTVLQIDPVEFKTSITLR